MDFTSLEWNRNRLSNGAGGCVIKTMLQEEENDFHVNISISPSFIGAGEQKLPFELFYELNRRGDEQPIDLLCRYNFTDFLNTMFLFDYIIINRDRHGANIEVIFDKMGTMRLAPLFDHGQSFLFSTFGEASLISAFDFKRDFVVNNYVGSRSLEDNLRVIKEEILVHKLTSNSRDILFEGLEEIA